MITARFVSPSEWNHTEVVTIEVTSPRVCDIPRYQVLIADDVTPQYLLKFYLTEEVDCFHELKYSEHAVVVGCGEKVHFFNLENQSIKSHALGSYFGHLYAFHKLDLERIESDVLVASASKLYMFSPVGELKWVSPELGIDGVIVHQIDGNLIHGTGEYDPPDGWQDFKIAIELEGT